jgi:hypothetical protein
MDLTSRFPPRGPLGEFPRFIGTIETLRLPTFRFAPLRFALVAAITKRRSVFALVGYELTSASLDMFSAMPTPSCA